MDKQDIIQELERERQELQRKLTSLDDTILYLRQSSSILPTSNGYSQPAVNGNAAVVDAGQVDKTKYKNYPVNKSNRDKAAAILKAENRFLHMREIVEIAQALEPKKDSDVSSSIRQAVYALKSLDQIIGIKADGTNINTFWGSKNWLDESGKIKPEHMYREDQVKAKNDEFDI